DVTLTASSPAGSPTMIAYRIDGGNWAGYTSSFSLTGGRRTIDFQASDADGFLSPLQTLTVDVDYTPPTITSATGDVIAPDGTLSCTGTDDVAGVAQYEVSIDGSPFVSMGTGTSVRRTRSLAKGLLAGIPSGRGQYTHVGKGWRIRSQAASTRKARSIRGGGRVRSPEVTFEMTHISGASSAPRPWRIPWTARMKTAAAPALRKVSICASIENSASPPSARSFECPSSAARSRYASTSSEGSSATTLAPRARP